MPECRGLCNKMLELKLKLLRGPMGSVEDVLTK